MESLDRKSSASVSSSNKVASRITLPMVLILIKNCGNDTFLNLISLSEKLSPMSFSHISMEDLRCLREIIAKKFHPTYRCILCELSEFIRFFWERSICRHRWRYERSINHEDYQTEMMSTRKVTTKSRCYLADCMPVWEQAETDADYKCFNHVVITFLIEVRNGWDDEDGKE